MTSKVDVDDRARGGVAACDASASAKAAISTGTGSATAALVLGVALMGIAMPASEPRPIACEFPVEQAASALTGFTTEVGCSPVRESRFAVRGPARLLFGLHLDVNRATREALEALPAIGPARAGAIVRARAARRFESLADLERVSGIGRKTSEGLRGWAVVTSAPVGGAPNSARVTQESRWIGR